MSRPVRILSLAGEESAGSVAEHCSAYDRTLAQYASFSPDFIVFPENATIWGNRRKVGEQAETLDGPSPVYYRSTAVKHGSHVVGCFYLKAEPGDKRGEAYNAAVVVDRSGKLLGTYKKTYPVCNEYTDGIVPGEKGQPPVMTEYGPVGVAICFDIGFKETWEGYGEKRVRIVFWPSAYPGGAVLAAHAVQNCYYVVTSTLTRRMRVFDPMGRTVAVADERDRALAVTVELDEEYVHMDYANKVLSEIRRKYGAGLTIEADSDLGWYRFVRKDGVPPLSDILGEYNLVPCRDYYSRSRGDVDRQRQTGDAPKYEHGW